MIDVARDLGWLSADERWDELARMLGELQAAQRGRRRRGRPRLHAEPGAATSTARSTGASLPGSPADDVPHAAVRACLGSAEGHARTLQALSSPSEADVRIAQAYLRHRPITDAAELRAVAAGIARMRAVRRAGARAGDAGAGTTCPIARAWTR